MELQPLLELADDAAAEGEYEGAYHLLMATLFVAEHRGDHEAVMHVGATGRRLGVAAMRSGPTALFEQLDALAEAARHRLERAEDIGRATRARA